MKKLLLVALFASVLLLALLSGVKGWAHQSYPNSCCGGKDCTQADRVVPMIDGATEVYIGQWMIVVPRGHLRLPSNDGNYHICLRFNGGSGQMEPSCFFVPPEV